MYDENIEETITPNNFLFGRKVNIHNTNSDNEFEVNLPTRMKYTQAIISHFWKRWSTEYLTSLREYQRLHS